ncbi:hypothetical protein [Phaeocystidibacter luteus]|uniref:Uncharacterized protein n=1 Tax=Phaeocystidibacter luteus TaxID=911197 RepID=A0A6N6RLA7_9FLAO|nr:hypothetical protein [Phaeocystidibacter luteus]KAB2814219.1 hypothetical protein F8C67_00380 [Phaeocystidibacter luteus]
MDIQSIKAELVKGILQTNSKELLDKLYSTFKAESKGVDFWNELSDEQKSEIEIGLNQIKNGESIELEEFLKKVS